MNMRGAFSAFFIAIILSNSTAIAASSDDEKAAAGCLACGGGLLFLMIGLIVLNIVLLVWVARDARARGMDNSVVWMILVLVTGVLGLIIYFFLDRKAIWWFAVNVGIRGYKRVRDVPIVETLKTAAVLLRHTYPHCSLLWPGRAASTEKTAWWNGLRQYCKILSKQC